MDLYSSALCTDVEGAAAPHGTSPAAVPEGWWGFVLAVSGIRAQFMQSYVAFRNSAGAGLHEPYEPLPVQDIL